MWRDAQRLDEPSELGEQHPTRHPSVCFGAFAGERPKMNLNNVKNGP